MSFLDPTDNLSNVHFLISAEITVELSMSMFIGRCARFGYFVNESGHCVISMGQHRRIIRVRTISFVIYIILFLILVVDLDF
jgi:hypothetical protein